MPSNEYIKKRTQEIYDSMPQDKELRKKCFKERDELVELNYSFFGYIAAHKFVNNSYITYEDKLQAALLHFCEIFWWYKWKGDETHKAYRDDLAFTVFFKPRITEMMERDFDEVKYSLRRQLCMEAANQLGIHWAQLKYEDLAKVKLPEDKMIWDVGHQAYTHKILTGRKEGFDNLRQYGGMSGFPKRKESACDAFDTGHSSTSISAGLGLAAAREITENTERSITTERTVANNLLVFFIVFLPPLSLD